MSDLNCEELVQRVVQKLVSGYAPRKVILFGSYATEPRAETALSTF